MNFLKDHLELNKPEHEEAFNLARRLSCLNFLGSNNNWEALSSRLENVFNKIDSTPDLHRKEALIDHLVKYINYLLTEFSDRGFLEKINFNFVDIADTQKHHTNDSGLLLADPSTIVATRIEWILLDEEDVNSRRFLGQKVIEEKRARSCLTTLEEKERLVDFIRRFVESLNKLRLETKRQYLDTYRSVCHEDQGNDDHLRLQFSPVSEMRR